MHPLFLNLVKITAFGGSLMGASLFLAWMADRICRRLRCSNWWRAVSGAHFPIHSARATQTHTDSKIMQRTTTGSSLCGSDMSEASHDGVP